MNKTERNSFHGKFNNLAKLTLSIGHRIGQKLSEDYTDLYRVSDLLKAGIEPATTVSEWSPMQSPSKNNTDLLLSKVTKPDKVTLAEVLNTKVNINETIAVPEVFETWVKGRKFHYDIDKKGRAKVNLSEVTEFAEEIQEKDAIVA